MNGIRYSSDYFCLLYRAKIPPSIVPARFARLFPREIFYKAAHDLAGATHIARNLLMREMDFQAASLFRLFEKKNCETSICGEK